MAKREEQYRWVRVLFESAYQFWDWKSSHQTRTSLWTHHSAILFSEDGRRVTIPTSKQDKSWHLGGSPTQAYPHAHTSKQRAHTCTQHDKRMFRIPFSISRNLGITDWTVKINLCRLHCYWKSMPTSRLVAICPCRWIPSRSAPYMLAQLQFCSS